MQAPVKLLFNNFMKNYHLNFTHATLCFNHSNKFPFRIRALKANEPQTFAVDLMPQAGVIR